ncbi:hypothetical protein AB0M10_10005 [Streptomyces sp. NPDC051840]|uniref:Rv1733c family protein n=1 Tax=unclassified Streptomyces TaxID=2593676 RepID=UPI003428A7A3
MTVRAVLGIRRWRRNPVCRATDRHESWVALAALMVMALAAPVLGWGVGSATDDVLVRTVRSQQDRLRPTTAVVVHASPHRSRFAADPETAVTGEAARTSVVADWTAPDGTPRTGTVSTSSARTTPGSHVRIWTDAQGRPAMRPMDTATAHTHSVLAGIGAALLAIGLTELVRRFVVWRMMQGRYERLDRAWAEVGPDWGRTGTGS